jgi:hypothetical protein
MPKLYLWSAGLKACTIWGVAPTTSRTAQTTARAAGTTSPVVQSVRSAVALTALALSATTARAQIPASFQDRPPLGAEITVGPIGDLPTSANLFALLDTIVPDVIADRIEDGGTAAGSPSIVGAHGSTWTQTAFRVGDADITNPTMTGVPLLMPGVDVWEHVEVATGMMPIDVGAPGMEVTLIPRTPGINVWSRALEVTGSAPAFNAGSATATPPPIDRLSSWAHGNLLLGGPVSAASPSRLGALFSATWNRASYFERDNTTALDASLASAFLSLTGTTESGDQIRAIGWGQRTSDAVPHHAVFKQPDATQPVTGAHAQASWQHLFAGGDAGVRAFGAYTIGRRSTDLTTPTVVVMERLRDGPVPSLLDPGVGTDHTWSAGVRLNRTVGSSRHLVAAGLDLSGALASRQSAFAGRVGELLNGIPARIWDFTDPADISRWSERSFAAFVGDTFALLPRVTLNGGVRVETIDGSADAHGGTIAWRSVLPRGGLHVGLLDAWHLGLFGEIGRYGHRLPLADLAYGDPTAPTAAIYRWNATAAGLPRPSDLGPLVQRLGPGSGGVAGFSAIDPALARPVMDEVTLGFEARPHPALFVRVAAIARRETNLINVVDVGVPESAYTTIGVPDTGVDVNSGVNTEILTFYNRPPSAFGADRYLLTNPAGDDSNFVGADVLIQMRIGRTFVMLGGTAGRADGVAASRGFGPFENDPSVLGEAYIDPNALDHARGRDFTERGYTAKISATHQFRGDWTLGLAARYQDGQHFARLVIMPGLNQGPEAVRAFRNGRTRFSMTSTLDLRLQKGFTLGSHRLVAIAEGFNVLNEYFEYEEVTVTGVTSRNPTATQPPFAMHLGIRIPF